ncbi:MAG TPA: anti-sigma factor [Micromonosporaceae bacterium]|nr:anti-sigma factor [Micromonosporaceae bacterium]
MSTEIHALAGAYALDAVDDVERAAFGRHLAECETCALEVNELRETVGRLADSTWELPPPRLRATVLDQVRRTRQKGPGRADRDRVSIAASAQRWRRWTAGAVAAGIIAIGAATGTYVVQEERVQDARQIQAVLEAPDAVTEVATRDGGELRVVSSDSLDAAVVIVTKMPEINSTQAYQLWKIRGNAPTSAGVLAAGRNTGVQYVGGVNGYEVLAMTLEQAGGAAAPSDDPLASVTL